MDLPGSLSEWVKLRRKRLDLTQEELAQRAGCSVFALRKIESGERRPSKQLAGLLAAALEIPPADQPTFIRVARGELNLERMRLQSLAPASGAAQDTTSTPLPGRLPVPPVPLIGREPELSTLERYFNDPRCRLLTLTGLGGIGKTRLALEFASSQRSMFPDGVYYVPLASLGSPGLIIPAIADVFGLSFSGPTDPKDQLLNFLANRTGQALLLVLDNLEHLLVPFSEGGSQPDAAGLVMEILQRLPRVKILATSRERLNLHGEWTFEIHGLPVPPSDYPEGLEDYGAITLFMQSARRVRADFEVPWDEQPALIRVCSLLEGIPLAIELAAAWVGMLSCQEIAQEIETNLDFLTTSLRDVPERHRSIRATFDHSWKLLPDEECRVLRRLAVFHGGFSRRAAEEIAGASLAMLASLISKSLVHRTESGRYDLHEVIRQYALPYLAGDPQNVEIRDRHCEYYLRLLSSHEKALKSAAQQEVVREMAGEMDNVRAAWAWAIRRGFLGLIGQTLRCFGWLFHTAGWLLEGIDQIEPVVQALRANLDDPGNKKLLGHALAQQGLLFFRKGQFDRALALYEESLALLQPSRDPAWLTDPLVYCGIFMHLLGDIDRAQALIEEGLACALAAGDRWFEAYAVYNLGYIASLTGRYADGYEQMLAGLAMWRELGDPSSIALGLNYISPIAIQLGHLAEARAFLQESLSLCEQLGDRWSTGTAYRNLGLAALTQGSTGEAQAHIRKSLEIFGEYIEGWDIARSLAYLGDALRMAGNLAEARSSYLEALRLAVEVKAVPLALDALLGLAQLQLQAGRAEGAVELVSYVLNHAATVQATKDNAIRLVLEAGKQLDDRRIQTIREGAMHQSLDTIVEKLLWR